MKNRRIPKTFLSLVILQAIHSTEEFIFKFYERFPPMVSIYQDAPNLAKPAFVISNTLLFFAGLACFHYWVRPARKPAPAVVWVWIILESVNVGGHLTWAVITGSYNPGLATTGLFVPVLIYLTWLMHLVSGRGTSFKSV